jgi:hypothetical protein
MTTRENRTNRGADVDIAKERERADNVILVHIIVRHSFHAPCANFLALDTAGVYCLLLRGVLNAFDNE